MIFHCDHHYPLARVCGSVHDIATLHNEGQVRARCFMAARDRSGGNCHGIETGVGDCLGTASRTGFDPHPESIQAPDLKFDEVGKRTVLGCVCCGSHLPAQMRFALPQRHLVAALASGGGKFQSGWAAANHKD
jgi:hypothetical protein